MKPRIFLVSWMLVMTLLSLKLVILVTFEYHRPKGVDYMIRIIYFLVLLVLISSPVSAQITSSVNNFDNAKIIYYKSNPQSTQFPKLYLLKKYITKSAVTYYLTVHNKNGVSNSFSDVENAKIKIDNDKVYELDTKISYDLRLERQSTIRFDDTFAKVLLTAKKMEFQFPVFVNRTDEETNYYHVLVPNDVLSEFKQVIQMQ
jgi:hypothetical protein